MKKRGMFFIKGIICAGLTLVLAVSLSACKNSGAEKGYVESGELVVIEDSSDIKLGIYGIDTLNPIATKSESVRNIMNTIYDPLFTLDEELFAEPVLADFYELSEDGRRISVTLKNGVKWHDGTNFTADDVVFTLSKLRNTGGLYSKLSSKIASFTAVEKNKVIIEFDEPQVDPAYLLTFPILSEKAAYSEDADFVPVGTGAYKFASKSSTEIVLEPSTLWHGGEASQKRLLVKILKDGEAAAEAFNVNELDAITSGETDAESVAPKMNSHAETVISQSMVFLGFNTQSAQLASASVRSAVNGFLDRQKLLEKDAYGRGMTAELSINPTSWIYRKIEAKKLPEDYSEKLLAGDGYALKDGIYRKNDMPLSVRILVNEENSSRTAMAESIAAALNASGFSAMVEKASYDDYVARIAADDFDMFIGEMEVDGSLNPAAMLQGSENYFNFDASLINDTLKTLYGVSDRDRLVSGINEIYRRFYADPPYLPLYFRSESVIYGSYVSGIEKPVTFDPYKGIEKWYFYDKDGKESKENADE